MTTARISTRQLARLRIAARMSCNEFEEALAATDHRLPRGWDERVSDLALDTETAHAIATILDATPQQLQDRDSLANRQYERPRLELDTIAARVLLRAIRNQYGTSWEECADLSERDALARLIEHDLLQEFWTAVRPSQTTLYNVLAESLGFAPPRTQRPPLTPRDESTDIPRRKTTDIA